jgi:hypothetical protein
MNGRGAEEMDENELRSAVAAGLEAAGEPDLAVWAADWRSTNLKRLREIPGGAVVVLFEAFPHPNASFYAGLASGRVFYLTGQPGAFADMMRTSGLQVTDEQTAADVACAYTETTRTFYTFVGVLDSADDINWDTRPGHEPAPEVVARLRQFVQPPAATAAGQGRYQVSLSVQRGSAAEHRVLTVTADGAVTERTEDVISGLPVLISS